MIHYLPLFGAVIGAGLIAGLLLAIAYYVRVFRGLRDLMSGKPLTPVRRVYCEPMLDARGVVSQIRRRGQA